ncbi:MAG TPA: fibronectin type III domain-containing protein, partial [Ilumatobacteraceae bacterium]|nr:fibronectin type III domain-containing protein [Ilumatobacteraceae bacterium]
PPDTAMPAPLQCVVSGLPAGQAVDFDVTATNDIGTGAASTSNAVTPTEALSLDLSSDLAAVEVGATVTFTVTAHNAADMATVPFGLEAASLQLQLPPGLDVVAGSSACVGGGDATVAPAGGGGTALDFDARDIEPGADLMCSVAAVATSVGALAVSAHAAATSAAGDVTHDVSSGPVTVTVTAAQPPEHPPTDVGGNGGDGQIVLHWSAPIEVAGRAPITGYVATATPGGATCATATTTCTISGLSNGAPYTVTVYAVSGGGPGPVSEPSAPLTPTAPPTVTVTAGSGQSDPSNTPWILLLVTFDQPVDGFDVDDLVLGGTAGTAAAIVRLAPVLLETTAESATALPFGDGVYVVEVGNLGGSGTLTVTVHAGAVTNANGQPNAVSPTFSLVYDVTPPVLTAPTAAVTATAAAGATSAVVSWSATTEPDAMVVCSPQSGSAFPVGTTQVTCRATDAVGNVTTSFFDVVVSAAGAPISPPGGLPDAGTAVLVLVALALAVLAVGIALSAAARRRRTFTD